MHFELKYQDYDFVVVLMKWTEYKSTGHYIKIECARAVKSKWRSAKISSPPNFSPTSASVLKIQTAQYLGRMDDIEVCLQCAIFYSSILTRFRIGSAAMRKHSMGCCP